MEAGLISFGTILALIVALFAIVIALKSVRIIRQSECAIIERLGSYNRTLTSGINFVVPIIDQNRSMFWVFNGMMQSTPRIDLRETVLDIPEQSVITKDNVSINIDALLYIQVVDPIKATYEIANLPLAVAQLAQTSLRNVIGALDLDDTLTSRDTINSKLKTILDEATDKWGTKVNRVELKNITPPMDIQNAMEKQMQAERERRAKILDAEGDKQARVARSEGMKQEQINLAEGEKEAQVRRAEGEAEAIKEIAEAKRQALERVNSVLQNNELTAQYLTAANYLESLKTFTQKEGDKVFIPYEASTALGSIGTVQELLKNSKA